jgi:two-component system, NtrC family, response regulator AtoC
MSQSRKQLLIVDDEQSIRESLTLLLKSNFEVSSAKDGIEAMSIIESSTPDLVLMDVLMPRQDGLETLKKIKEKHQKLPVIMLTATNTVKSAVEAMKQGAFDYISKPFDIEELTSLIVSALQVTSDTDDIINNSNTSTKHSIPLPKADFGPMVGQSPVMSELFEKVQQVAERNTTVLITGESGTGKELIARQIHQLSPRKDKPFIAINCAAIPEALIESELFGHEKGAFTHAVERRIGHFELADAGTLFLDEIGELSLSVQVKMLRFLQEQEFYRVGRSKPLKVDVRIIAATNKNLEELIKEKKFRQDLFYRVNVIALNIPPLRDRFEDIPNLTNHFLQRFAPLYGNRNLTIDKDAMDVLVGYDWPGNVRELENLIESIMALAKDDVITVQDLPRKLKAKPSNPEVFRTNFQEGTLDFEQAERVFETEMIVKALKKTNWVQTKAAELLGISRRILKYKMDKLGIGDKVEGDAGVVVAEAGVESDELIS